tara:strand:- start:3166 stop:3609 length:444 start_codon:yes stop_codon:yes gene_type:complete
MIKFKPLTDQAEWDWMAKRASPMRVEDSQGLVAYNEATGVISGIVVMDSWTKSGCQAHIAIDNPMCIRAGLLREAFFHIHVTCDRKYVFGTVPAGNKKAYDFDLKMGFEEVARIPDGYAEGVDYIIIRMSRENNPWLPKRIEQKEAA